MDIVHLAYLRVKMIVHSKSVIFALLVSSMVSVVIIMTFFDVAEKKSNLPIGIIDLDKTDSSKKLIDELKNDELFSVKEEDKDDLMEKLENGEVYSVFVIDRNFENKLKMGKTSKLMIDYYADEKIKILSDVVLSKLMKDICIVQSSKVYESYSDDYETMSEDDYKKFIDERYIDNKQSFSFDFQVVNRESNKDVTEKVKNSILYKQIIVILVGTLITFVALFAGNIIISDKRYGTNIRLAISKINKVSRFMGDLLGLYIVNSIFSGVAGCFIVHRMGFDNTKQKIQFLIMCLMYTLVVDVIFIILTRIINEPIMYQIVGAMVVCALALTSVVGTISFMLSKLLVKITSYTPLSLFKDSFIDITINNKYKSEALLLFIMGVILMALGILIQIVKREDLKNEL